MENNKCPKLDDFCYVCGHIVPKIGKQDRKNLFTAELKTAYCNYFDETDLSGANFTPNTVCKSCYNTLIMWIHGKGVQFSFMKPVIWVEDPTGHDESRCYACINFFLFQTGTLNGPDIRKLMKSESFTNMLSNHYNHLSAWDALKQVIEGVLGKNRVHRNDIQTRVDKLLYYFEKINASMTLKLHFMHFHLDIFLAQLPQESDEQGERFHQVTMPMEKRFKGKKLDALLAEVCWWSSKIMQFEDESSEDEDDTEIGGHTEENMPLSIMSNPDDDTDSEHEYEQPTKKTRSSEPQASTSTRMDIDNN